MSDIEEYMDIDAIMQQRLNIDTQDLYLLVLGAAHHFVEHDDEQLMERFVDLMLELAPSMSNRTKTHLFEYLFENVHSGREIACADKWEELLDMLDDCPIIQHRIKGGE